MSNQLIVEGIDEHRRSIVDIDITLSKKLDLLIEELRTANLIAYSALNKDPETARVDREIALMIEPRLGL